MITDRVDSKNTDSDGDAVTRAFYLGRANGYALAGLGAAAASLIQTIAFANLVASSTPPMYCRVTGPLGFALVYLFFALFLVGYLVAIRFCTGIDQAYQAKAGLGPDTAHRPTSFILYCVAVSSTLFSMAIFTAAMVVDRNPGLCSGAGQ